MKDTGIILYTLYIFFLESINEFYCKERDKHIALYEIRQLGEGGFANWSECLISNYVETTGRSNILLKTLHNGEVHILYYSSNTPYY